MSHHYRCVGVGVGPANLSLASLLHKYPDVPNLFLDQKDRFCWHDGQQIPDASLQVSMVKDLVSLSDPTSKFSFLSYLHDQGKLYQFINAQFDAVPRQEFRNYLDWASQRNDNIVFGEKVIEVDAAEHFVVRTSRRTVTADNIVVGVGTRPWVPGSAEGKLGETQYHVSEFVHKARALQGKRVAVVGGGQSGAEAFLDLISRPEAERPRRVTWISRRGNYFPLDDSPFTNEYYTPDYSDYFFSLGRDTRRALNSQHLLTSDGISEATLREIYQRCYINRFVHGDEDLVALLPNHDVTEVTGSEYRGWVVTVANNHHPEMTFKNEVDVIIWATGFRPAPMDFLAPIAHRFERDGDEFRIDEDYAIKWDGAASNAIFLQNAVREQRGLADPNLSLNAWRSQRIVDRLLGVRTADPLTSFISWSMKPTGDELQDA